MRACRRDFALISRCASIASVRLPPQTQKHAQPVSECAAVAQTCQYVRDQKRYVIREASMAKMQQIDAMRSTSDVELPPLTRRQRLHAFSPPCPIRLLLTRTRCAMAIVAADAITPFTSPFAHLLIFRVSDDAAPENPAAAAREQRQPRKARANIFCSSPRRSTFACAAHAGRTPPE